MHKVGTPFYGIVAYANEYEVVFVVPVIVDNDGHKVVSLRMSDRRDVIWKADHILDPLEWRCCRLEVFSPGMLLAKYEGSMFEVGFIPEEDNMPLGAFAANYAVRGLNFQRLKDVGSSFGEKSSVPGPEVFGQTPTCLKIFDIVDECV